MALSREWRLESALRDAVMALTALLDADGREPQSQPAKLKRARAAAEMSVLRGAATLSNWSKARES